jgi:hypothetical protein
MHSRLAKDAIEGKMASAAPQFNWWLLPEVELKEV